MKKIIILFAIITGSITVSAQNTDLVSQLQSIEKNEYVILEVRMQLEDEFQTVEGNESANLSRLALFTGENKGNEILSKGFEGFNQVVANINTLKENGFILRETYSINGNSLLITHYVFQKSKK